MESPYDDARFITPAFKGGATLQSEKSAKPTRNGCKSFGRGICSPWPPLSVVSRVTPIRHGWCRRNLGGLAAYLLGVRAKAAMWLGVQYAMLADQYEAGSRSRTFLQSALTGHWAGMCRTFSPPPGSGRTSPFSPATPPVTPIQARFMEDRNGEAATG